MSDDKDAAARQAAELLQRTCLSEDGSVYAPHWPRGHLDKSVAAVAAALRERDERWHRAEDEVTRLQEAHDHERNNADNFRERIAALEEERDLAKLQLQEEQTAHQMTTARLGIPELEAENERLSKFQVEHTYEATLGVGDGSGKLFVHGSYEAIKRMQEMIFENERLRALIEEYRSDSRFSGERHERTEAALAGRKS